MGPSVAAIDFVMNDVEVGVCGVEGFCDFAGAVGAFVIDDDGEAVFPEGCGKAFEDGGESFFGAKGGDDNRFFHEVFLDVESGVECVVFNELPAGLYDVAHEDGEDAVGVHGVFVGE